MKIGGNINAYTAELNATSPAQQTETPKQAAALESDTVVLSSKATELNKSERLNNDDAVIQGGHFTSRPPP